MADNAEAVLKVSCPKCKKPAKKLGLAETIHPNGRKEAKWVYSCDVCDYCFDVPKPPASH